MKNTTRLLPGFHLPSLRRKPKTTAQKLAEQLSKIKEHSISQLSEFFNGFIPQNILKQRSGARSGVKDQGSRCLFNNQSQGSDQGSDQIRGQDACLTIKPTTLSIFLPNLLSAFLFFLIVLVLKLTEPI